MMMLAGSLVSESGLLGLQVTKYLLPAGDFVTKTGEGGGSVWPLECSGPAVVTVTGCFSEVIFRRESVSASEMFAIEIRVISGLAGDLAFGLA